MASNWAGWVRPGLLGCILWCLSASAWLPGADPADRSTAARHAGAVSAQSAFPHRHAHAHNDYEHARPLLDALSYGFTSVEADVHLSHGKLLVAHDRPDEQAPELEEAYLLPLSDILKRNEGDVFKGYEGPFLLMIDIKTEAVPTYRAIRHSLERYSGLICKPEGCPVKVFLSGNRPLDEVFREGYQGIGIDGRPEDLGKGYSAEMMPVVSDSYDRWSAWTGDDPPADMQRIKDLADRVHREGKLLRLWAIPDNSLAWKELLNAGVDLINTDKLVELHHYLSRQP